MKLNIGRGDLRSGEGGELVAVPPAAAEAHQQRGRPPRGGTRERHGERARLRLEPRGDGPQARRRGEAQRGCAAGRHRPDRDALPATRQSRWRLAGSLIATGPGGRRSRSIGRIRSRDRRRRLPVSGAPSQASTPCRCSSAPDAGCSSTRRGRTRGMSSASRASGGWRRPQRRGSSAPAAPAAAGAGAGRRAYAGHHALTRQRGRRRAAGRAPPPRGSRGRARRRRPRARPGLSGRAAERQAASASVASTSANIHASYRSAGRRRFSSNRRRPARLIGAG